MFRVSLYLLSTEWQLLHRFFTKNSPEFIKETRGSTMVGLHLKKKKAIMIIMVGLKHHERRIPHF